MSPGGERSVAVELAELRGVVSTGFARLEERVAAYKVEVSDVKAESGKIEQRVKDLEARRWPMGQVTALSGVVGTMAAVASLVAFK